MRVIGIDNDMRGTLFGAEASVSNTAYWLEEKYPQSYKHYRIDLRNEKELTAVFARYQKDVELIIHTAGQPSHDWAAQAPMVDFQLNAQATLSLLMNTRTFCPEAVFIYTSTNKVYGDVPNAIVLEELPTRYDVSKLVDYPGSPLGYQGINEHLWIDKSMHSLFGVSKLLDTKESRSGITSMQMT
jgi:CDP-paratose 2-epimerase